ncbi:hypothetical protein [Kosmotoga olearia]|uniref:Uncharacterized protein n=1 Tax=Kosmotoga olearia (strain ATCC BAA-1733 / DSM 21960 / TBF 19.5.1) TaxID=521045 RepID=C5CF82_KOSOT|nr:hypothetical protein [Kosmotoga olearia]ACR79359.1 hypothetical protein Kole_0642 [Kosmotoga olearia TBF 19.5.1]
MNWIHFEPTFLLIGLIKDKEKSLEEKIKAVTDSMLVSMFDEFHVDNNDGKNLHFIFFRWDNFFNCFPPI